MILSDLHLVLSTMKKEGDWITYRLTLPNLALKYLPSNGYKLRSTLVLKFDYTDSSNDPMIQPLISMYYDKI